MVLTGRTFAWAFVAMLAVELLALAVFFSPIARTSALLVVVLAFLILALRRLDLAFLVMTGELVVGSQGHLLDLSFHGLVLSLRMAFFVVLFCVWLARRIQAKDLPFRTSPFFGSTMAFLAVVVLGIAIGLVRGNNVQDVYLDANAFLFLVLAPLIMEQVKDRRQISRVIQVIMAGMVFLALQSLVLLAVFSHGSTYLPEIYRWVRDSRLYEINRIASNFFRIFSQAQFFSLPALLLLLVASMSGGFPAKNTTRFLLGLATLVVVLVSFSRSFWLALVLAGVIAVPWAAKRLGCSWKRFARISAAGVTLVVLALLVISFAANFPYLWNRPGGQHTLALLEERTTDTQEAAAGSRYALFGPLTRAALRHPVLGSGFGTAVTYATKDPHFVDVAGGVRTTYAFEWGYLDLWLKTGILGLGVVILFLVAVVRTLFAAWKSSPADRWLLAWMLLSVLVLVVTHALTPYLNHPIGLFLLLLAAATGEGVLHKSVESTT